MKDKKNKVSFEEITPQFITEMARGMNVTKKENGGKYEIFNWTDHTRVQDYLDAIQRHLFDFRDSDWEEGNDLDEETGVSHLALIACNCMMAYYHVQTYKKESRAALKRFFKNDEDLTIFMDRYKDGSLWNNGYDEDEDVNKTVDEFDFSKLKEFDGHVYLSGKEAYIKIMDENKTIEKADNLIRYDRSSTVYELTNLYNSKTDNYYIV